MHQPRQGPRPAPVHMHAADPGGGGSGLLAALTLLLVAFTNTSLLGLAFLLAFLAWGSFCPPATAPQSQAALASKRLWAAVSGLSALALLSQLVFQAAFLLGAPDMAVPFFALLGFPQPQGPADALLAVVPLLLALMASAGQVQAARDSSSQQARRQAEGTELQQLGLQHPAPGTHPLAARAWAAAVALLAAAMAQPSVLAGPYMLAAAAAVWRWSGGGGGRGGSSFGLALLRPFTAAYLVALYLWQALSGWAALQPAARVLGLFSLSSAADQGWQQLVPAAVQLAAMLLLFLSLAGAQSEAGSEGGVRPARHAAAAADASWDAAGERSPLLQRQMPQPQQPSTQPSGASPPPRVATDAAAVSVQQLMYTLLLDTAEALCREPAAVAALLCCTAMVQPSALGGLVLLLGLAALLARPAAVALQRWSRALTAALLVWQLSCYGATVAAAVTGIPAAAQAAGLQPSGAPWSLLAILASAAATAGLAWSVRRQPSGPILQPQQQPLPPRLQHLLMRIGSMGHPGGSSVPTSPTAVGAAGRLSDAAAPWLVAWHLLLQGLFYCGLAAVPVAVFAVGASAYDVLHGLYLAGLLAHLCGQTLRLKPTLNEAILGSGRHWILRCYASLHLAAVFVAYVGGLQGTGGTLQPTELQQLLSIIGLWHPTVASSMLPLLGLLLLATLHSSVGRAVRCGPQEQHYSNVDSVATWHSAGVVYLSRLAVAYGPGSIAVLGYCLVLVDCDISLVGLVLLSLLATLLTLQPQRGQWQEQAAGGSSNILPAVMRGEVRRSGISHVRLLHSPIYQWLPLLLLTAFSASDFLAQAVLPAAANAAAAGWLPMPEGVLEFVRTVVGLSQTAHGLELALRLLRPLLLLASIAAYRCCFCLGTLHRQLQYEALPPTVRAAHRLRTQLGLKALGKRLLVLHGSKVVALLALAAAMQPAGAIGWLLAVGVILLAPMLGAPTPGATHQQRLLRASLLGTAVLAICWMVAQYALCVPWLQDLLLRLSPDALDVARWVGLLLPASPDPGTSSSSVTSQLEHLLRLKCLLLVAVALRLRAFRWHAKLPDEVRAAGRCGAPCPLFWPQSPDYAPPPHSPAAPGQRRLGPLSLVGSLREAAEVLLSRAQHVTQQALRAVDWPAGEAESPEQPAGAAGAASDTAQAAGSQPARTAEFSRRQQWRVLRFALQDWVERVWQEWHLDITLFVLLLGAFSAANALSLAYIAVIGAGMALPARATQAMFKWVAVPLLGVLAVFQYSVLLGPPPMLRLLEHMADDIKEWLGLAKVDASALWLLFLSFGAATLLVHFDDWARCAQQSRERRRLAQRMPEEGQPISRASSFDGIESPTPLLASYAAPPTSDAEPQQGEEQWEQQQGHTTLQVTASGALADVQPGLWQPLTLEAQAQWRWTDWLRYAVYRHYLDVLLCAVVSLCTLENDIIHAAYLATALFFFRSRIVLRQRRNSLFFWLPLLNYVVMLVTLVYQAPLQLLLPARQPDGDVKECSLAHLIGLFRLDPGESLLSLGYRGALADCLLWALMRVQSHIFASATYDRVQRVVWEEEEREKRELLAEVACWKEKHAAAALQESRQRAARQQRMARLKAACSDSSVQQLYSFLGLAGDGPRTGTQVQPPQPLQPLQEAHTAAMTEYEKELSAAASSGTAEGEPPVAAATTAADAAAAAVAVEDGRRVGGTLRAWLRQRLRRVDRESVLCYFLMVAAFLADCSLLMLALPLSAFTYALVSVKPSKTYWQVVLMYTETLVVAQFAWMVPERLRCEFLSPQLQHSAEVLGIHGNPVRSIPLFLVYLSTLFHTYSLATRYAAGGMAATSASSASAAPGAQAPDLEAGTAAVGQEGGAPALRPRSRSSGSTAEQFLGETLGSSVSGSLQRIGLRLLEGCYSAWEFLLRSCGHAERPPHYLLVRVAGPAPAGSAQQHQWGQQLRLQLQHILDGYRRTDISAARERQDQRAQTLGGEAGGAAEQQEEEPEGNLLTFESVARDATAMGAAGAAAQESAQSEGGGRAGVASNGQFPDLSRLGPLQLTFVSLQPCTNGGSSSDEGSKAGGDGSATALLEVAALRSTPDNTEGWCSVPGWPMRSLNPARTAAATLLRYQAAGPPPEAEGEEDEGAGVAAGGGVQILAVEHYSRQPQDWYAATTAFDFAAFLFVAVAYNRVVSSAGSLSDITSRQVIPLDFLFCLMVLFGFLVMDRVAYTLGSPLSKALLHLGEMLLWLGYSLKLFWSPLTSTGAQNSLRIMLLLKCSSFALGALQLRSGFPPAASAAGLGRHSFWFMQKCNTLRAVAFQVFLALPFVYELRQLLDWSCTSTTLTLMDWFKLEDINTSLYFCTWNRKLRASKRLGERQPRWLKLLQGALLFAGLLLLLWVPLLLFSSAAPTYVVPIVETHAVNATLLAAGSGPGSVANFPLFSAGGRRQQQQYLPADSIMPDDLAGAYTPEQFQLLCTSEDADRYWEATPPAQQQLLGALLDSSNASGVSLSLGWSVKRDLPLPSEHGGPLCTAQLSVPLAPGSRRQLAGLLQGESSTAQLLRSDDSGEASSAALYPLAWLLRGDLCVSSPLQLRDVLAGSGSGAPDWSTQWVACNASLLPSAAGESWGPAFSGTGSQGAGVAQQRRLAANAWSGGGSSKLGSSMASWWQLDCWAVNASSDPLQAVEQQGTAQCGGDYAGPRLVAVLERVQGGIIGQTLSRYGVAGLYTVVVLSVGRFLRLGLSNTKARIPFEDLPTTVPLVALCQDIYLARAEGLLATEERLFWRLVDLYRLPSVMYQLTGPNPPPMRH